MNERLAVEIASDYLQEEIVSAHPIIGKGSVNCIFAIDSGRTRLIVRMNDGKDALRIYEKERWCMEQAAYAGIPGPSVLLSGQTGSAAYMLLSFVEGENGEDAFERTAFIWRKLGEYARMIRCMPVRGFGEQLSDPVNGTFMSPLHDNFDGTWTGFLDYNIGSLTDDDELVRLGVLGVHQLQAARERFEALRAKTFTFGLTHGDLTLRNTIIDAGGNVSLLDWGSAEVAVVPHWPILPLLRTRVEQPEQGAGALHAFLDGYGICTRDFEAMANDLTSMLILSAFDKLRWAIDRSPGSVPEMSAYAAKLIGLDLLNRDIGFMLD